MSESMPTQEPPSASQGGMSQSGGAAGGVDEVPTMLPAAAGGAIEGGVAAWLNDKRVVGLWAINQNRNSWVYINGVGWKRLANNSDSAVVALTMLAAHAKQSQTSYTYRDEADGMIHECYVW